MSSDDDVLPADWRTSTEDVNAAVYAPGLSVLVHGVEWLPASRNSLLAALEVQKKAATLQYSMPVQICLVDDENQWSWGRREQIVVGTPCLFFYYAKKKLRLNRKKRGSAGLPPLTSAAAGAAAQPPPQALRDDRYVGHFSSAGLLRLVESAVEAVASCEGGGGDPKPIELPSLAAEF